MMEKIDTSINSLVRNPFYRKAFEEMKAMEPKHKSELARLLNEGNDQNSSRTLQRGATTDARQPRPRFKMASKPQPSMRARIQEQVNK